MQDFPSIPGFENGLPPQDTRILDLRVEPWPDGKRIRVHAQLTPFSQRPNLDLTVLDSQGEEVASVSLIESMLARFVVTLHLRPVDPGGNYKLVARLFYPELDVSNELIQDFQISPPHESTAE